MPAAAPGLVATLIPVIVGGLIGLAGGWLGPWLLEGRKEATEKKRMRAQKFEEMVAAIFEFDYWIKNLRKTEAYGYKLPAAVSPFAKIEAISAVYFPNFAERIVILETSAARYRAWMTDAGTARVTMAQQTGKELIDVSTTQFAAAYQPYAAARNELLNELKGFARKEFQ
jgi:hypothetical protein